MLLPTYDVFDEWRYFAPAAGAARLRNRAACASASPSARTSGTTSSSGSARATRAIRSTELAALGIDLLINIASSPYHMTKRGFREEMLRTRCAAARRAGRDGQPGRRQRPAAVRRLELRARQPKAGSAARALSFESDLVFFDTETGEGDLHAPPPDECEAVYDALVMGLRDYVRKCGFHKVVLGLSGGIDSSLTAALAVDALGAENVTGLGMPGPYSSEGSLRDARELAEALGVRFEVVPITSTYDAFLDTLAPLFDGCAPDVTEENIQARLRGATLMAYLQQVRRADADHRQQERDRRRLLHALRRHGRRAGGHLRRAQDAGLRALPRRQPPPPGRHPRERLHQAAFRRAAARPEGHRFAAALRGPRPASSSSTSRNASSRPRSPASSSSTSIWCAASAAWSTATSTSASRRRRGYASPPKPSASGRRFPIAQRFEP